jgi:hypothetical protein
MTGDPDGKDVGGMTVNLADAASEALGGAGDELQMEATQEALVPACKVRFQGMSWDSLDAVPDLKSTIRVVVEATVVAHEQIVDQKTGDVRDVAKAKVTSVRLLEDVENGRV